MSPGFLLIDKPPGPTSHDIVNKIRRITGIRKVGHAGTLDPFASGLLLIGVERAATKLLGLCVGLPKTYEATFVLGATSETDDPEGPIHQVVTDSKVFPDLETIRSVAKMLTGTIEQLPPRYAAIKMGGKKLYELARSGTEFERVTRTVSITTFDIHTYEQQQNPPVLLLTATISCSSGTYIRSIARDLGEKLGIGGYVTALRRTAIGPFLIDERISIPTLSTEWNSHILPAEIVEKRVNLFKKSHSSPLAKEPDF